MNTPFLLLVLAGVLIVAGLGLYGAIAARRRQEALAAWAAAHQLSFNLGPDYGMAGRFPELKALREGEDRYAYNILRGRWQNRDFFAFDYHYLTITRNSKGQKQEHHHHFSVAAVTSHVPLQPLQIRPEGFLDRVGEFFGAEDINFESAEFSRRFHVWAADKRWAYDVLHPRTMQLLLDQPDFRVEFFADAAVAYRTARFELPDLEAAATVLTGILDGLPDYLIKQQRGQP